MLLGKMTDSQIVLHLLDNAQRIKFSLIF